MLDSDHWEYKEETGNDFGRDCIIELSENNEWNNHKVVGQIKVTSHIKIVTGDEVTIAIPVKTIEYALGSPVAFILFVVDVNTSNVYFQCIQQFFIENKEYYDKLDQITINIHIPINQNLENNDELLRSWARTIYVGGPGIELCKYEKDYKRDKLLKVK